MRKGSTPKPWVAARASPESLSRMRLKTGVVIGIQSSISAKCGSRTTLGRITWTAARLSAEQSSAGALISDCFGSTKKRLASSARRSAGRLSSRELLGFLFRLSDGDGLAGIADLEAGEAAHRDVLAQLADLGGDQLRDADRLVLDEGLLQQADLLVELGHLAFDDLLHDVRRLARWQSPGRG